MNQSQIAIKVGQYLLMKHEVLYRWKRKDTVYGIYGDWQYDIRKIQEVVEEIMGVSIAENTRKMDVVCAKRLFIFLVFYTTKTKRLQTLADYMGFISHATIIHHRNKMKDLIEICDPYYLRLINLACFKLGLSFIQTTEKHEES
jgi:chromosomal replication initiation ATPase DnaA